MSKALETFYNQVKELFPEAAAVAVSEHMQTDDVDGKPLSGWTAHAYRSPISSDAEKMESIAFGYGDSTATALDKMKTDAARRAAEREA